MIERVGSNPPRVVEHSNRSTTLSKLEEEYTILVEDLHPVVVFVRHDDVIHRVGRNTSRSVKLSRSRASLSKFSQKVTIFVEDLDSMKTFKWICTCIRLLLRSATKTRPWRSMQIPQGRQSSPSPLPSFPNEKSSPTEEMSA